MDELEAHIAQCDARIEAIVHPFAQVPLELLQTIPGVGQRTAEGLLAEIGVDMTRFPTAAHLASWAGMCPGNNESAGTHKSGKMRKGDRALRTALIEAAWAASHRRHTALASLAARIARRRGAKKAAVAVGHRLLIAVWYILTHRVPYRDLGPCHLMAQSQNRPSGCWYASSNSLGFMSLSQQKRPRDPGDFLGNDDTWSADFFSELLTQEARDP